MSLDARRRQAARSPQDILGGIAMVLIGVLALYLVNDLPATGRVGFASGTAPRIFAYCLIGLGLAVTIIGWLKEGPGLERLAIRGPVAILGSVLFFAFAIRYLGLAATGVPMVLIATAAARENYRWKEALIFAIGITAFCAVLFPIVLGQPIPLWPTFGR
ncbi:MAG: tripartite tricarboxylate transporter TctB family protein [Beijerinckiaceae bacterium]|jgi:putative tricarboxylic transport membrane protein|nr:tripartite tricarboxylate transporter TctB family protein [Beijerinckiaceae bacterium]